ncbi:LuxR family transcriptional regulator [Reyranella sp. CPCC 100927]|uniref:helix-turn-helix transcriptional regulator n=1 Tax=Reyranella sp. CPCC 100927 TaxID=2599616 RepID=UPI0011B6AA99|nr:LuxR family transcriptional regulator [Reyranella sp. CPCC 100927]TWT11586.1 LuxR family transcriptional regulator [Reyranella sp. CPCC 100927]
MTALRWDIVAQIEACADMAALAAFFADAIAPCGYTNSAVSAYLPTDKGPAPHLFFTNTPESWRRDYIERNMSAIDSIISESRRRIAPFTWTELRADVPLPDEELPLRALVDEWGLKDGFVVPIHGPGGYFGVASLVSTRELPPPSAEQRAWLHMLSFLTHERCRALEGVESRSRLPEPLSVRERDCLRWVAAGKSDWEIGRILGIAPTTVKFHIERARNKLGVHSRAQAVARLFLWGGS